MGQEVPFHLMDTVLNRFVSRRGGMCAGVVNRPDDGGNKHPWNVGKLLLDCEALQTRRQPIFTLVAARKRSYTGLYPAITLLAFENKLSVFSDLSPSSCFSLLKRTC
jgi:hypothetical protein